MSIYYYLTRYIHFLLLVGTAASIFIDNCYYKEFVFNFLVFLLIKYMTGQERCGLTELEYYFLGEQKYQEGFIYRLITPIVKVSEQYFSNFLYVLHISWIIILFAQLKGCGFF